MMLLFLFVIYRPEMLFACRIIHSSFFGRGSAPQVLNDQYVVTNSATGPKSFYRLKK